MGNEKYVYSVDKIKLEFQYLRQEIIQDFLNMFGYSNKSDNYYISNSINKCKHNFKIELENANVYLGIQPNWHVGTPSKNIILEYNPNKINPFKLDELKFLKNHPTVLIKVLNFDLSVDIDVRYDNVRMLKRDTRESFVIFGKRHIETRYLGAMGHNHIKLYNKALEQGVDIDWTRFEITVKKINSLSPTLNEFLECIKLPQIFYINRQMTLNEYKLNDVQLIVLNSLIDDPNLIYSIKAYNTRMKYVKLINKLMQPIEINIKQMYNSYINYSLNFKNFEGYDLENVDVYGFLQKNNTR